MTATLTFTQLLTSEPNAVIMWGLMCSEVGLTYKGPLPNTEIELLFYLWAAALAGHTSLNKPKRASGKTQSFNCVSMSIGDVGPGRYS